jgi:uncharacterized protein YjbJ (UPF0337 family)
MPTSYHQVAGRQWLRARNTPFLQRKTFMNANQVNGTVRAFVGKLQEQAGQLVGSRRQQLRGLQKQVLGNAEKKIGDFQEAARNTVGHGRGIHL